MKFKFEGSNINLNMVGLKFHFKTWYYMNDRYRSKHRSKNLVLWGSHATNQKRNSSKRIS